MYMFLFVCFFLYIKHIKFYEKTQEADGFL